MITATYTNLAMSVTMARDEGILKRMRGTPLPAWAYLAGRIGHAIAIGVLLVIIVAAFGAIFYGVEVPWRQLPELMLTLVLGAATFCVLGLALTAFVPNADAAPAVVNATILPLLFISNVFIRLDGAPAWIEALSSFFPVRHFADAMLDVYAGNGLAWSDLGVMAAWASAEPWSRCASSAGSRGSERRGIALHDVVVEDRQEARDDVVAAQGRAERPVDEDRRHRLLEGARQADPDVGVLRLARPVDDAAHHRDPHLLDAGMRSRQTGICARR